jgi:hypothetical protein
VAAHFCEEPEQCQYHHCMTIAISSPCGTVQANSNIAFTIYLDEKLGCTNGKASLAQIRLEINNSFRIRHLLNK